MAVKDGEVTVVGILAKAVILNGISHSIALFLLVDGSDKLNPVANAVVTPQLLLYLIAVAGDDAVGSIDDVLRRSVVLFELEEVHVGVVALEVENVLYVGPAESVDTLCVVTHHTDVLVACGEFLHYEVLCVIGVLVLVDHNVLEALLVLEEHVGEIAEEDVHVEQQVVEVHSVAVMEALVVHLVDGADGGAFGVDVGLIDFGVLLVVLGTEEVALGHRDAAENRRGLVGLRVEVELLDDLLDGGFGVVGVVDSEGGSVAELSGFGAEHTGEDRVEGAHPEVAAFASHQLDDTFFHLVGGLVGEGQCQDAESIDAEFHEVGYAVGEGACLAAAGAGNNHHRPIDAFCRLTLRFVQLVK